jgi:hypothetical protein
MRRDLDCLLKDLSTDVVDACWWWFSLNLRRVSKLSSFTELKIIVGLTTWLVGSSKWLLRSLRAFMILAFSWHSRFVQAGLWQWRVLSHSEVSFSLRLVLCASACLHCVVSSQYVVMWPWLNGDFVLQTHCSTLSIWFLLFIMKLGMRHPALNLTKSLFMDFLSSFEHAAIESEQE